MDPMTSMRWPCLQESHSGVERVLASHLYFFCQVFWLLQHPGPPEDVPSFLLQVDLHSDGVSPGPVGARWGARCGRSPEPAPVGFFCVASRRRYSGERAVFGPKTRDLGNRCKRGNVQRKLSGEVSFLQASKMWEQVCVTYVRVPQCLGTDAYVGQNHRCSFKEKKPACFQILTLLLLFLCSRVGLQYCVNFRYTAKWFSYSDTFSFWFYFVLGN